VCGNRVVNNIDNRCFRKSHFVPPCLSSYDLVAKATAGETVLLPLRGVNAESSHMRPSRRSLNRNTVSIVVNRTCGDADVVSACLSPMR